MVDTYFYGDENLHPLYSVSKLLTAMAVGIAIEKQMKVNGKNFNLETNIYDALKDKINITNIKNIEKIKFLSESQKEAFSNKIIAVQKAKQIQNKKDN